MTKIGSRVAHEYECRNENFETEITNEQIFRKAFVKKDTDFSSF